VLGDVSAALIAGLEASAIVHRDGSDILANAHLLVGLKPSAVHNLYAWQEPSLSLVEKSPFRGDNR